MTQARAPRGQGLDGLKARARAAAAELGHDLGLFHQHGKKSRPLVVRGQLIEANRVRSWQARCKNEGCIAMCVIHPDAVPDDHTGFGGTAITKPCHGWPGGPAGYRKED